MISEAELVKCLKEDKDGIYTLDLSHKGITNDELVTICNIIIDAPDSLYYVERVDFSNNKITELTEDVGNLTALINLSYVNFSGNKLTVKDVPMLTKKFKP